MRDALAGNKKPLPHRAPSAILLCNWIDWRDTLGNRIADRVRDLLHSMPDHVRLVAAAKTRSAEEAREAIAAGVTTLGHNYVREAETMRNALRELAPEDAGNARWHLIGHLQRNKARRAVAIFDMIETVDSLRLARAIDGHCRDAGKIMPVLIEINSGREPNKSGVLPDDAEQLIREIAELSNVHVEGLMTMGPIFGDPEDARPYFRITKEIFDRLAHTEIPNAEMRCLSMGMSNSYEVAIEEGANIVRIGTKLFGARDSAG